jgi:hypothetical protein
LKRSPQFPSGLNSLTAGRCRDLPLPSMKQTHIMVTCPVLLHFKKCILCISSGEMAVRSPAWAESSIVPADRPIDLRIQCNQIFISYVSKKSDFDNLRNNHDFRSDRYMDVIIRNSNPRETRYRPRMFSKSFRRVSQVSCLRVSQILSNSIVILHCSFFFRINVSSTFMHVPRGFERSRTRK